MHCGTELVKLYHAGVEKEMATHSSILAWEIPWTEEPGVYSPWNHKRFDLTTNHSTMLAIEFLLYKRIDTYLI